MNCSITVIIPTLARGDRRASLFRAIDSVISQVGVHARPLVVINGERYDPSVRLQIERLAGVRTIYVAEGNVGLAHHIGVREVGTPYYSFLDDDDLLLPGGLSALCREMTSGAEPDYVVGNGYIETTAGEHSLFPHDQRYLDSLRRDPAAALLQRNWLASCGGLYRRGRVGTEVFDGSLRHFEWTYYAFRLACRYRGAFIDVPVFRVSDTPESVSKSLAYSLENCEFLDRLESMAIKYRPDLLGAVHARQLLAYNGTAISLSRQGRLRDALACHGRVLGRRGGWKFLPAVVRTILRTDR